MRLPPSHIQLPEWHVFGRQKLETRVHSWILCRSSKCCFANLGHKAGAFERNVLSCRLTRTLSSLTFLRKHPSTHAGATCAPSSTCYVRQQIGCHLMFNCLSNTFLPSSAAGSPDSFDSEQIEESYWAACDFVTLADVPCHSPSVLFQESGCLNKHVASCNWQARICSSIAIAARGDRKPCHTLPGLISVVNFGGFVCFAACPW